MASSPNRAPKSFATFANWRELSNPTSVSPYKRPYHQRLARVIDRLDSARLRECGALFGGGTLISLVLGEFRVSRDLDFLCPVGEGYRRLRQLVDEQGAQGLFQNTEGVGLPRPARADQYGVRFPIAFEGELIKLEIFCEARIALDPPENVPGLSVGCLSTGDRFAEKLLANADRWADDSIEARDLIDLAMMRRKGPIPHAAVAKAAAAYEVEPALKRALEAFGRRPGFRARCIEALEIHPPHLSDLYEGLNLLAGDLGLPRLEGVGNVTVRF
ncbi:MAG: nucleotidyl transferase AbiEii/AbiGii toxin family protein [Myxococcota bacterium]